MKRRVGSAGLAHRLAAAAIWVLAGMQGLSAAARADTLRILTSLPPAMTTPFVESFKADNPGVDVLVLNKNTVSAMDDVLRDRKRGFDVFWASAPEAFEIIDRQGGFNPDSGCPATGDTGYVPFAISSIGWTLKRDSALTPPRVWDDLLLPAYLGQIGMAPPSRSGTTHMLVERFLQVRGWEEGWAFLLGLSQNLSTITSRSFAVTDGVRNGRFGIGLTIDFLAGTSEPELQFHYGTPAILFPAQIGLLGGAGNVNNACRFITLVTDVAGQRLLLQPGIGRIPVSEAVREQAGDAIPAEVRTALKSRWLHYNAALASDRFGAVNVLFDLAITNRLDERRSLWRRLRALEGRVIGHELDLLSRQLVSLPISESEALRSEAVLFATHVTELTDLAEAQRTLMNNWEDRIAGQLAAIEGALGALEIRVAP